MSSPDAVTVARAVVIIHRHLEQATRRAGPSLAQYRLLLLLKERPQRASVIAAAAALSKGAISQAVNGLRARGWVSTASDGDGRTSLVMLTPEGHGTLEAFEAELAAAVSEGFGPQHLAQIAEAVLAAGEARKAAAKPG